MSLLIQSHKSFLVQSRTLLLVQSRVSRFLQSRKSFLVQLRNSLLALITHIAFRSIIHVASCSITQVASVNRYLPATKHSPFIFLCFLQHHTHDKISRWAPFFVGDGDVSGEKKNDDDDDDDNGDDDSNSAAENAVHGAWSLAGVDDDDTVANATVQDVNGLPGDASMIEAAL
jgi:hypothetical protein